MNPLPGSLSSTDNKSDSHHNKRPGTYAEPGPAMIGGLFFLPALFALPPLVLELEEHLLYDEYTAHNGVRVARVLAFRTNGWHLERQRAATHSVIVSPVGIKKLPCLPCLPIQPRYFVRLWACGTWRSGTVHLSKQSTLIALSRLRIAIPLRPEPQFFSSTSSP